MTADEVCEVAFAECDAIGHNARTLLRKPLYERISMRQQDLFTLAAGWNEEFLGWTTEGQLVDGEADFSSILNDTHPTVPGVEKIVRIEVSDPGSSLLATGTEVNIVKQRDARYGALSPRAVFRSGILTGYQTDLDGVEQVEVYYVRRPRKVTKGSDEVEFEGSHVDLLVLDLAKFMLQRDQVKVSEYAASTIESRERRAFASFELHVRSFTPTQDRFS